MVPISLGVVPGSPGVMSGSPESDLWTYMTYENLSGSLGSGSCVRITREWFQDQLGVVPRSLGSGSCVRITLERCCRACSYITVMPRLATGDSNV